MRKSFIALVLGVLLTIPCVVRAEEVEIQLMEVITMQPLPGDNPLDAPYSINVAQFLQGTYILRTSTNDGYSYVKFLKQ